MMRNLLFFFYCYFIVSGLFAMKESKCLDAALNLKLLFFIPALFLLAAKQTINMYICVFFTWSFLIPICVW